MITRSVTSQQFTTVKLALQREYGLTLEGNRGVGTLDRVTAQIDYNPATGFLTAEVLDKPMLMPKRVCEDVIGNWLHKHLA